jgi:S-adenosylmethionine decarboxylase proenzyme
MNLGKHIIVDMFDIDIEKMKNINATEEKREFWEIFIKDCFNEGNITLLAQSWKDFDKEGAFTALYLLAESHLSIHTWPEHKYIALDVFTCGDSNTQLIVDKIIEYFEPKNTKMITLERGDLTHHNKREVISKTNLDSSLYYLY